LSGIGQNAGRILYPTNESRLTETENLYGATSSEISRKIRLKKREPLKTVTINSMYQFFCNIALIVPQETAQ
jgi:hypothetical protein